MQGAEGAVQYMPGQDYLVGGYSTGKRSADKSYLDFNDDKRVPAPEQLPLLLLTWD